MQAPTSDFSKMLYAGLMKMNDTDGNAGKRWRAKKIIDEFECGYTCESIFVACARKLLKIADPDQARLDAEDAEELKKEKARLIAERIAQASMPRAPEQVEEKPTRRKRRKRLPDGTLPPWPTEEQQQKRRMPAKRRPKEQ